MIVDSCVNLRDVRITARKIPINVVVYLALSRAAFLVASTSSEPYGKYFNNCVGTLMVNNLNLAWSKMSHECIEQCIRQNLADSRRQIRAGARQRAGPVVRTNQGTQAGQRGDRGAGGQDGQSDLGRDGQRTRLPTGLSERQAECVNAGSVTNKKPNLSTNLLTN